MQSAAIVILIRGASGVFSKVLVDMGIGASFGDASLHRHRYRLSEPPFNSAENPRNYKQAAV
ncbi:hypothetical protein ACFQDN_23410 [Pseudomonas asuensis]|uniref:GntT/GntP/DsdX family permease n=1 Tax=Pseudomonas asuensis TaxID=1825787 RepID=UPI001669BAB7